MRFLFVVAAVAAVSLAGCGKKAEEGGKPSIQANKDGYTVRSRDGAATVVTGKAAAEAKMPDFAPMFPGAMVESSVAGIGNGEARGGTVVYKVPAKPEAVIEFYTGKATASGLKTEMSSNMGAARMFSASDEVGGRALQVIASDLDGGASVQVIWATKKK